MAAHAVRGSEIIGKYGTTLGPPAVHRSQMQEEPLQLHFVAAQLKIQGPVKVDVEVEDVVVELVVEEVVVGLMVEDETVVVSTEVVVGTMLVVTIDVVGIEEVVGGLLDGRTMTVEVAKDVAATVVGLAVVVTELTEVVGFTDDGSGGWGFGAAGGLPPPSPSEPPPSPEPFGGDGRCGITSSSGSFRIVGHPFSSNGPGVPEAEPI